MGVSSWTNNFQIVCRRHQIPWYLSHSCKKNVTHTFTGKAAIWNLCLTTENKYWPKHEGNTCLSNTWIFYYPMTRPPLSSPWSMGDAASSPPRAGCHCPSTCQLSASSPLCCQDGGRKLLRDGKHKTGPPQWIFDDSLQSGFSNPVSALWVLHG